MAFDLIQTLLTNLWVFFLVVMLFGGSIFVHELGHFLAARRRGAVVERFSIGFGPPIFKWRGKDGVEYRVSYFPLGGYVLLPQLADLGSVEGRSNLDAAKLPPVTYTTKMIVFVAGAVFNVLFAFLLACIVWIIGQPTEGDAESTKVAEVLPTIKTADDTVIVSPAAAAGLKVGDVIIAIDGKKVTTFGEIRESVALGSGWNKQGEREAIFTVQRGSQVLDLAIRPVISGRDKLRTVGFRPQERLVVGSIAPKSAAERAGLQMEDRIVAVDETRPLNGAQLVAALRAAPPKFNLTVSRKGVEQVLHVERAADAKDGADVGIVALRSGIIYTHPTPFEQVVGSVTSTIRNLGAMVDRRSDINLSHASGPIGIISNFFEFSRAGIPFALWFTIVVNVNLAIFNLLPLPILDGGQMLFATIARLRGRPLPVNFIVTAQSVFLVLLLSMVLYVSFFDIRRWRDLRPDTVEKAQPAAQKENAAPPPALPAPAK